jgi:hypothetical protein
MRKIIVAASIVAITSFAPSAMATEGHAHAATNAEIMTALTIANNTDLAFGKIAANPNSAAVTTVTLTALDTPVVTVTSSGGELISGTARSAAKFTVLGENSTTFHPVFPTAALTLTGSGGSTTVVTVDNFVQTAEPYATDASGSMILYVGGTLNVAAAPTKATYSNAAGLTVTVTYN